MAEEKKKRRRYTAAQAESAKKYLSQFAEIRIRLQPEEKQIIMDNAKKEGKSVNQYLKDLALK